jgi:hypothetical protein
MSSTADTLPFEEIRTDARYELFRRFSRYRLINGMPWAIVFVVFIFTQPPLWRQLILAVMTVSVFTVTIWD